MWSRRRIALERPLDEHVLTVQIHVIDDDGGFTGDDDMIGDDTFTFTASEGFGAPATVHVRDMGKYRITLSIVTRR